MATDPRDFAGAPPLTSKSAAACVTQGIRIKGELIGSEDLFIDGQIEGSIIFTNSIVTVGPNAKVKAEISAREVVVYGKVIGNLHARDRVDVRKDGSVVGDISTARITIEDGAQFKGRIEIDPSKSQAAAVQPDLRPLPTLRCRPRRPSRG